MRRKVVALVGLIGAWIAAVVFLRRAAAPRRDRGALYYDDGSIPSLSDGPPEAARLLPFARQARDAARGG